MTKEIILPCPFCGHEPKVYHGMYGDMYGDSIECDRHECPGSERDDPVWYYTSWENALWRWNEYVAANTKQED